MRLSEYANFDGAWALLLTGAGVAVISALALGLLKNFSELGQAILQKEVFHGPILYGGYGDLILIVLTLITFLGSFIFRLRYE